jgi:hypothetical protein
MPRRIRVTIKEAMSFWNDDLFAFVPNMAATRENVFVVEVPDAWVDGAELVEGKIDRVYANIYGEDWRTGNSDFSRYEVLESKVEVLATDDPTIAKCIVTA